MPSSDQKPGGIDGFRFNAVTEEPTRQVIIPRADPAARRRILFIIVLAVLAVLLLVFLTVMQLGTEVRGGPAGKSGSFRPSPGEPGM